MNKRINNTTRLAYFLQVFFLFRSFFIFYFSMMLTPASAGQRCDGRASDVGATRPGPGDQGLLDGKNGRAGRVALRIGMLKPVEAGTAHVQLEAWLASWTERRKDC